MKYPSKAFYILLIALFSSTSLLAQQADFSGTWALKQRSNISGPDYANGVPNQIKVSLKTDSIRIERISTGQGGQNAAETEIISLNEQANSSVTPRKRKKTVKIKWTDHKSSFTESAGYSAVANENETEIKITEVWTLSGDGKTLTVVKSFESEKNADDKWSMKGEYNKE